MMTIRKEIKQSRPFRSRSQEAVIALLRTTDQIKRHLARTVESEGITLQQYNVLRILRGAHPDPLLTLEIADRMIEHAPGITRLLDRLEARQMIRRERCSNDRRRVHCWITDQATAILDALEEPVDRADDLISGLGKKKLQALISLLEEVRARM